MRKSVSVSLPRWGLVLAGAGAMGVAGTYQFVWSSIRPALDTQLGVSSTALGTVFTLFVIAQTLAQFPAGKVRDRHGPRLPLLVAAVLLAVGYAGTGVATGVFAVAVSYTIGGIGAGIAYTVAVNTPVKWFSDRRGLATGVVTMAYGGVSVLLIPFVRGGITAAFGRTIVVLGIVAGTTCLLAAAVLRDPTRTDESEASSGSSTAAYTWRETTRTWQFWVFYGVFILVNGVGLMIIGKAIAFATGLGLSPATATGAASALALADSLGLIVIGGASDRLGEVRTAGLTLSLCGVSLAAATLLGANGFGKTFVVLLGAAAFFRSPVFSIFPNLVGEYYGEARSSENYAVLYSAKVWGGVIGGTATSVLIASLGWTVSFLLAAGAVALTGIGVFALEPVDRGSIAR
jgi:OFA family oxalate/formate antiporter-like MFS transporter